MEQFTNAKGSAIHLFGDCHGFVCFFCFNFVNTVLKGTSDITAQHSTNGCFTECNHQAYFHTFIGSCTSYLFTLDLSVDWCFPLPRRMQSSSIFSYLHWELHQLSFYTWFIRRLVLSVTSWNAFIKHSFHSFIGSCISYLLKPVTVDWCFAVCLRGYCTPGPYFWRLCTFSPKIKQLRTKYPMDLVRNVPRNSKITVLLQ